MRGLSREMANESKKREELLRELELENRKSNVEGLSYLQAVAERSGLNLTDLHCINILTLTGPITAGRLGEMMGLTTGAITGVVNRLERSGYVRREKDPDDARRVVIQPVEEELERVEAIYPGSREERAFNDLLSDYDDRDLALFLEVVHKSNAATREETARIRASSRGGEFSAPMGSAESGRLVFANGASRLTLRAASGMDDLYHARFEGEAPKTKVEGASVTFRYSRRFGGIFDRRGHPGEVTLNAAVPWEVEVRGGAYKVEADLGGLELSSLVLKGGISHLDLTLPEPSGVVPVRLSGGASKVDIRRPAGVEARLNVKSGAATLTFDEQSFDALGGKVRLQSPGYHGATDRYEIEVSGGASDLTLR
jgi:DNA-binding MarR family transcriptional regulator